ncbi:MAG TPA: hypothetical protein VIM62_03440, partial [Acidobacteriaceae bacterium]
MSDSTPETNIAPEIEARAAKARAAFEAASAKAASTDASLDAVSADNALPEPATEVDDAPVGPTADTEVSAAPVADAPVASDTTIVSAETGPVDPKVDPQADTLNAAVAAREVVETAAAEPEESFADIFSEFQRSHQRREESGQLRGTIVSITPDAVLVDIGFKIEGMLPPSAFAGHKEAPKAGDTVLVSTKGRTEDGYYALSLFRTAVPKDWTGLQRAFDEKLTVPGTVTAVVKGGLRVDVGVQAFLPASRSGARDAAEME